MLIDPDFLPEVGQVSANILRILKTIVENSVSVSNSRTAAHLHCPPLQAALAAEVVIGALKRDRPVSIWKGCYHKNDQSVSYWGWTPKPRRR